VSRAEVEKIVEEADKDGTGLLSEKEFVNSSAGEGVSVVSFLNIFVSRLSRLSR
jgi:hypothetical protein